MLYLRQHEQNTNLSNSTTWISYISSFARSKGPYESEAPNSPHHNLFYPTNQWVYWKSSGLHPYLKGSWPLVVLVALQDHDMSKDINPTLLVIVIHLHIIDQLWYTQEIPMCVSEFPARISILVESPCSKFISTAFWLIEFIKKIYLTAVFGEKNLRFASNLAVKLLRGQFHGQLWLLGPQIGSQLPAFVHVGVLVNMRISIWLFYWCVYVQLYIYTYVEHCSLNIIYIYTYLYLRIYIYI